MSLRATQKDTTGRRDMSHHWSGTKPLTRAQRAAAESEELQQARDAALQQLEAAQSRLQEAEREAAEYGKR